jgi:predicted transposase/invertase (TIGR01784 family)
LKDPEFIERNRNRFSKEQLKGLELMYQNYRQISFTKKEKTAFDDYDKATKDEASRLQTAKEDGIEIGEKRGEEKWKKKFNEEKIEIAKGMLKRGLSIADISELTGLSLAEIKKLQK